MFLTTRLLSDAFLLVGLVGFFLCFSLHRYGSGNLGLPISVEYSEGNPCAHAFVLCTFLLSGITSVLYWRMSNRAESYFMLCVTLCILVIAITSHRSEFHGFALCLALVSMTAVPIIHVLRKEFSFSTILIIPVIFSTNLVLAIMAALPNSPFGLGIAERIWFVVTFLSNSWNLDVVHLGNEVRDS